MDGGAADMVKCRIMKAFSFFPLAVVLLSGTGFSAPLFSAATNGVVEIAGTDTGDFVWHESAPVKAIPGSVCGFSISARRIGTGIMAFGTRDAFVEQRAPDASWYECRHVYRVADDGGDDRVRLGTVGASGAFSFKGIRLRPLKSEHLVCGDLVLGHGESLVGNDYHFSSVFESTSRGVSRCLENVHASRFRTFFWDLREGGSVTYRHRVGSRNLQSAQVTVTAAWGENGETLAEASADGRIWVTLGALKTYGAASFNLPGALFPAAEIRLRLRCTKGKMFQVTQYTFDGRVDGSPGTAYGWTKYRDAEDGSLFAEVKAPPFTDKVVTGGASLLSETKGAAVWSAVSDVKVFRTTPVPEVRAAGLKVALAANESESVQLVVRPGALPLEDVRVAVGSLKGSDGQRLPAANVTVSRVGYVNVRVPSDEAGAVGLWPDPLLPQDNTPCSVKPFENQPFWITVSVPKKTPSGVYRGEVRVAPLGVAVPIEVEVFGFELPDRLSCETAVGLYVNEIAERSGLEWGSPEHEAEVAKYLRLFADNRISPFVFGRFLSPDVTGWDGDEPVLDWTRFDRWQKRLVGEFRANTLKVPPPPRGLSEARSGRMMAAIERHFEENGWLDRAYVYASDEPSKAAFPKVNATTSQWKKHAPKLRRMVTKEPVEELADGVDLWCPRLDLFHSDGYEKARARGDGIWWYICCGPRAPYPCEFIDHAGSEMRTWLWMTWAEKMRGILLWQSIYWRKGDDPYAEAMSWAEDGCGYGNGDGRFIYPPRTGESGPHPSIRLEQLRDGLEDYEYFTMLRERSPKDPLLAVPKDVFTSYRDFSADPMPLRAHRAKVASVLDGM